MFEALPLCGGAAFGCLRGVCPLPTIQISHTYMEYFGIVNVECEYKISDSRGNVSCSSLLRCLVRNATPNLFPTINFTWTPDLGRPQYWISYLAHIPFSMIPLFSLTPPPRSTSWPDSGSRVGLARGRIRYP